MKYFRTYDLINQVWILLSIGFLGYSVAYILIIVFRGNGLYNWQNYWHITRYVFAAILGLKLAGWIFKKVWLK